MHDAVHRAELATAASAGPVGAPILVTGAPRSGTTWVGNVLALERNAASIHEPFNRHCPPGRCRAGFNTGFTYVTRENEGPYVDALRDTMTWKYSLAAELRSMRSPRQLLRLTRDAVYFEAMRRRGARVIIKDPMALLSTEWLAERFGMRVVVVVRHPAAFVSSLRAAGWHRVHFEIFRNQAALMEDTLAPYADRIAAAAEARPDAIDSGALLWNILHHHILRLRSEHPDWIFVRHEDLAGDPGTAFRALYARLGLDFTNEVERKLKSYTTDGGRFGKLSLFGTKRGTMRNSQSKISTFRQRMTPEELARVRAATASLAAPFYGEADW